MPARRVRDGLAALGVGVLLAALPARAAEAPKERPSAPRGTFTLLTYNVAGLPMLISQSNPVQNIPVIGDLLNLYDVAVVQEDFAYQSELDAHARHAYRASPLGPSPRNGIGDGLGVFSRLPLTRAEHVAWRACNGKLADGSDCLAPKGFSVTTEELAAGAVLDLYNLHMDSGGAADDERARAEQARQLATYLRAKSQGHAVVVAGDTNMGAGSERVLETFLSQTGLSDACRSLACGQPELIDRVMYRSSRSVSLRAVEFTVDDRFVGADGQDLSDHKAVGVVFGWETRSHPDG